MNIVELRTIAEPDRTWHSPLRINRDWLGVPHYIIEYVFPFNCCYIGVEMDENGTDSSGSGNGNDGRPLPFYLQTAAACVVGPLALMGLIGNVITYIIFGKMGRQNAVTFLLRSLAVIDSCGLLVAVTYEYWFWSVLCGNVSIDTLASMLWPFMAVFVQPLYRVFLLANAWTSVIIGINRYIAVCRPLHAARLCTVSHARKQIACVVLFSFAYSLPRFLEYKDIGDGKYFGLKDLDWMTKLWYYYIYVVGCDITFRFLVPVSILLYVCVRLAMTLRAATRQQMIRHGTHNTDTRVTTMLVVFLGVFLVCQTPSIYMRISFVLTRVYGRIILERDMVMYYLFSPLCIIFNSSVNCLIYLAYNKQFRRKLCQRCTRGSTTNPAYELTWSKINFTSEGRSYVERPLSGMTSSGKNSWSFEWSRDIIIKCNLYKHL